MSIGETSGPDQLDHYRSHEMDFTEMSDIELVCWVLEEYDWRINRSPRGKSNRKNWEWEDAIKELFWRLDNDIDDSDFWSNFR